MEIHLNGEAKQISEGLTAEALIEALGLQNKRLAMEVNEAILPRSRFDEYRFKDGDQVEIVHAIGGG